jgi:hypothetical protein
VSLACNRNGKNIAARLSFTSTTRVDVTLSAGGDVGQTSAGPGQVTLTAKGRATPVCAAVVGGQVVGPVTAS